jgi:ribonuclease Z
LANDVPKAIWNKLQKFGAIEHEGIFYSPEMVLGDERQGIKISYVTDTRPIDTIPEFIKESDLFICEGTYGDDGDIEKAIKNKHMTFREAAGLAAEGSASELMLTHFSPVMQRPELYLANATEKFPAVIIGQDRIVKGINFRD